MVDFKAAEQALQKLIDTLGEDVVYENMKKPAAYIKDTYPEITNWKNTYYYDMFDKMYELIMRDIPEMADGETGEIFHSSAASGSYGPLSYTLESDGQGNLIVTMKIWDVSVSRIVPGGRGPDRLLKDVYSIALSNNKDSVLHSLLQKWVTRIGKYPPQPTKYTPGQQELPKDVVILPPYLPVSPAIAEDIFNNFLKYEVLDPETVARMRSQLKTKGEITDKSLVSMFIDAREKIQERKEQPIYSFEGLYSYILNKLIKVANKLDQAGLLEEADEIDRIIKGSQ